MGICSSFLYSGNKMDKSIKELINYLFQKENPIFISLLFVLFIFSLIIFFFKYLVFPFISKFKKEKELIELKNAKLMSLFAELDPDPLIRIDLTGKIIISNLSAKKVLNDNNLDGKNIVTIFPTIEKQFSQINFDAPIKFIEKINNKYFLILIRSDKELQISQLYFRDITERIENEKKIEDYQKQLKKLSEELQNKIEDERNQISKTLHDSIGQNLSLLRIKIKNFQEKYCELNNKSELNEISNSLEETINELKQISYGLKPRNLESMGLKVALIQLINEISHNSGIEGEFNFPNDEIRFDEKLEINIYRIVQESLNNIVKYSNASKFGVELLFFNNKLRLIISDNGKGFKTETILKRSGINGGMGLLNIKERVESFRGNLKIESSNNNGTIIIIEIPIKILQNELN